MSLARSAHAARRALVVLALGGVFVPALAAGGGTLVVLNKSEATASLLDLAKGAVVATLPTGEGPHEAAASPDGRLVLAANYGTPPAPGRSLTLIDVKEARVVRTIDLGAGARPHGLRWLDGHRVLVTAQGQGALLVVDAEAGKVLASIPTGQEGSHMVVASKDARRAFVANVASGSVSAIDLEARRVLGQVPTGKGAEGIAMRPDGGEVWVANREADTVSVIDPMGVAVVAEIEVASFPIRVAFAPDGKRAYVSCARSGDVAVLDVASRREVGRLRAAFPEAKARNALGLAGAVPVGIVIEPSGHRAYVAHTNADAVVAFDLASGTAATVLRAGREPDGMAFSPLAPGPP
jgi:YVTN family beta-propeller protein